MHDTMILDNIPAELAFMLMIVAFVAGYSLRTAISRVRRAKAGWDGHIDWDVTSESFNNIPTASSLFPPPGKRPNSRIMPISQCG